MIHHISIPAQNPLKVARVIAELFESEYCAFFPSHPGSYVTFAGDEYGTLVEVYPLGLHRFAYRSLMETNKIALSREG